MSSPALEARLFVLSGADLARSFTLVERNVLGRTEECEIVLADRSISRKHALVARGAEGWFVQDLGSTNGLWRAGKRLERCTLADGDEFKLGDLMLRFRLVPAGDAELEFAVPGPDARPAPPRPAPPPPAARPFAAPAEELEPEIEIELDEAPAPRTAPAASARPPAPPPVTQFQPRAARASSGLLTGELEQRPFWLRVVLTLAALALAGALAYGAFQAVQMLRAG